MGKHEPNIGLADEWKRIRDLLDYDPSTGVFRWRFARGNVPAGAEAGSRLQSGYLHIRINKRAYLSHRLAWFWMTGTLPRSHIDHRNMVRSDNRWCNLRLATNAENLLNRGKNRNNTSGYKGVSYDRRRAMFAAYLTVEGMRRFLGYHETAELAHDAYRSALSSANQEFGRAF